MIKKILQKAWNFIRHERGAATIIFAMMLPMLVASAGMAVDLATAYNSQSRLSNALDKAVLAAASSTSLTSTQIQARFQSYFAVNYPSGKYGTPYNVTLTVSGNTMTASAGATVPMTFMGIVGLSNINISASSQAVIEVAGVEAVLVLDTTGSMAGNNITALRTAANDFINIMFTSITDTNYLKIGIVPWSDSVNVGPYGVGLQTNMTSTYEGGVKFVSWPTSDPYINPASSIPVDLTGANQMAWGGCVVEPNAAAILQENPAAPNPNPTWPMYRYQHFSPATYCTQYNCTAYNCEQLACATCSSGDTVSSGYCCASGYSYSGGKCTKSGKTSKSTDACKTTNSTCQVAGTSSNGASCQTYGSNCLAWYDGDTPNTGCTTLPVLPMTNNQAALLAEIKALPTANNTYPDVGMIWGWRMISPGFPFMEGAPYNDQTWSKTVIMMTDGNATINTVASGEGYYGHTAGISQSTTNQNDTFEQICTNMKAQGIRIYTITFQSAINQTTQDYYSRCATNPTMYFNAPTNASLTTAFQAIATQLGQIHLAQ